MISIVINRTHYLWPKDMPLPRIGEHIFTDTHGCKCFRVTNINYHIFMKDNKYRKINWMITIQTEID